MRLIKHRIVFYALVLGIILPLLGILSTMPAHAVSEAIRLSPEEGEIGEKIGIEGHGFEADRICRIYFSSDKADTNDDIDTEVTAYKQFGLIPTDDDGDISTSFRVPDELDDGEDVEYVHGGSYYIYVTYHGDTQIKVVAKFTVIGGQIEINPEAGQVGTEVEISGEKFGLNQKITVQYDGATLDIASGDKETDDQGKFTSTIIIPASTAGTHIITATDEFGNEPEVEFSVVPKITLEPKSGAAGELIKVNGTGFEDRESITITVDGYRVSTTPIALKTGSNGSFTGSFLVPHHANKDASKIRASDSALNWAEAELTILAGIRLDPVTNQTAPGHVGMKLTIYGTGFTAETPVAINYDESLTVATANTGTQGNFHTTFLVPPSGAGNHTVTVSDGINTSTTTFTMEAEAPPIPVPLLPEVASTVETETHFDWEDVTDPSGITYTLQIGTDANFTAIILDKAGLVQSKYNLKKEEGAELTETNIPYYWRVRAIDNASNEGKWTIPLLFYVGLPSKMTPGWTLYLWIGLGALLVAVFGFWMLRRTRG